MIRTLLICAALFITDTARAEPLRILIYNVLYGFNNANAHPAADCNKKPTHHQAQLRDIPSATAASWFSKIPDPPEEVQAQPQPN